MSTRPHGFKITDANTVLPVTIAEARQQLRNEGNSLDDDYIEALIWAASAQIEAKYGHALIDTTIEQYHTGFPDSSDQGLFLRIAPLLSVESIAYTDSAGAAQTMTVSDTNSGSIDGSPFIVPKVDKYWPTDTANRPGAVTITYKAGFGVTAAAIPKQIKLAILLQVGYHYQNRENPPQTLNTAADSLLRTFYRFAP